MGFKKYTSSVNDTVIRCDAEFANWILKNKGTIKNGDIIEIAFGECAVIADGIEAAESCRDMGTYIYETDRDDLELYFVNMKEQNGGSISVPDVRFVDDADMEIRVDCDVKFNFAVADPEMFFGSLWAELCDCVTYDAIEETVQDEMKEAIQPAFNKLAVKGIHQLNLSEHTPELMAAVKGSLELEWGMMRGIELRYLSLSSMEKFDFDGFKPGAMFDDLANMKTSGGDNSDASDAGEEKSATDNGAEELVNGFANLFGALFKEVGESMMEMTKPNTDKSDDDSV